MPVERQGMHVYELVGAFVCVCACACACVCVFLDFELLRCYTYNSIFDFALCVRLNDNFNFPLG